MADHAIHQLVNLSIGQRNYERACSILSLFVVHRFRSPRLRSRMSTPTVISHMVLTRHNPMSALPIIGWGSKEPLHDRIPGIWETTKEIRDGDIVGVLNGNENRGMGTHY